MQTKIQSYCSEIEQKLDRMIGFAEGISEEELYRKPSAEAWSIMEILCHVEEILHYWPEELVRVVQSQGSEWGRGLQDPVRLAAVAQADQRQIEEVLRGIRQAGKSAVAAISGLKDTDLELEAPHRNPKFGVKPMSFLVDHFIVEHLENHIGQMKRNLTSNE